MKDIFIYKDYSILEELEKIRDLCYGCSWADAPNSKVAFKKCEELIGIIKQSLEIKIGKELELK